jgi:hypothetical protein
MKFDHGEYRSCFVRMADDADFHAMTGDAFKLLWTLKLTLPVVGIGVVYLSLLAEKTGLTPQRVDELLGVLAEPKPNSRYGWIVRDRNIVWIVNALASEPNVHPSNQQKHRPFVQRLVKGLPESSPAVRAFKAYYADWFPCEADRVSDRVSHTVSDTVDDTPEIQKQLPNQPVLNKGDAVDQVEPARREPETASPPPPEESKSNGSDAEAYGVSALPTAARRVLRDCYGIRGRVTIGGLSVRQKQVCRDLVATLGDRGAHLEAGDYVRAVDAAHLDAVCSRILTTGVRERDAALRLVLLELRKTFQETKAERERAEFGAPGDRAREPGKSPAPSAVGPTVASVRALIFAPAPIGAPQANEWFNGLPPPEAEKIGAELERLVSANCPPNRAPSYRAHLRTERLVEIWKRETTSPPDDATLTTQSNA